LPKWGIRILIGVGVVIGLFLVVATALQVPVVARSIGSPVSCATCHLMEPEVLTLSRSAHKDLACLDCHSARGFVSRPVEEIKSASRHLYLTLTKSEPDVIHLGRESRAVVQTNCKSCHTEVVRNIHFDPKQQCTDCHRSTPHDRPSGLRN